MFLHAPETHVSSPGPAPSPDAGGGHLGRRNSTMFWLSIFNMPLKEAPGNAALVWLRFGP